MSEKDLKTFYAVNVPKNIQILEAWKPTKDINFRLELFSHAFLHMNSIQNLIGALNRNISKVP